MTHVWKRDDGKKKQHARAHTHTHTHIHAANLPPECKGGPHNSTTPWPSRTLTALLTVWVLKLSRSNTSEKDRNGFRQRLRKTELQIISGTEQSIRQPKSVCFTQTIHSRVSLKRHGFKKRRHKLSLNSLHWFTEACFWCYTLSSGTLMGHHWLAWDTDWQLMRRSKACRALMKQMDLTWWCLPRDATL